jgi:mRNA interferase HigB
MHIITRKRIWEAMRRWPRSANALETWYRLIKAAEPADFAAMTALFPTVDKVESQHVFHIGGNKLRLIAIVHYKAGTLYIRGVLDHAEYDKGKWRD